MGKIAFVFAGQGAQNVGMGKDLFDTCSAVKEVFDMSLAMQDLCFNGPKEQLDITINTQPAVFLTDLACAAALSEKDIKADGVAGFSLGEIPAACYAGLMNKPQAFDFVLHRAKAMHECALKREGNMFAVLKLSNEKIEEICKTLIEAYPVNYNSPGQTVVACAESTAEKLERTIIENGGKPIKLTVSGAFHSPLMNDASKSVAEYLSNQNLEEPQIPLYSNTTAMTYGNSNASPKELLAKQVNHPVLWQKTIENMVKDGFNIFIEAGPGKTLSGLIKKINPDVRVFNVSDIPSLENTTKELKHNNA